MFKDFDFKIKDVVFLLVVALGICWGVYYVGMHQKELVPFFKVFDLTILDVQGILIFSLVFFLLVRLVSNTLVAPFLCLTEKREALTIDKIAQATKNLQMVEDLENVFTKRANEIRREAVGEKGIILSKARQDAEKVIFEAENEISSEISKSKDNIDVKVRNLLSELSEKKDDLASSLKDKILQI